LGAKIEMAGRQQPLGLGSRRWERKEASWLIWSFLCRRCCQRCRRRRRRSRSRSSGTGLGGGRVEPARFGNKRTDNAEVMALATRQTTRGRRSQFGLV
jgi:hypothetical protein